MERTMTQSKNNAIVFLRCIAACLITNSHFNGLYPNRVSFLAGGGYFGNTLFFLVSGYVLTTCYQQPFFKWYTKRILRIYIPYIIAIPFLRLCERNSLSIDWHSIALWIFPIKRFHFLPSIIILYPFYYFATYLHQKGKITYIISLVSTIIVLLCYYFVFYDFSYPVDADFRLIPMLSYYLAMLVGGILKEKKLKQTRVVSSLTCGASFLIYVYQVFNPFLDYYSIIQLLVGLCFSISLACFVLSFENSLPSIKVVDLIGNTTLEIYIVQFVLIGAFGFYIFPINVVFCFVSIVAIGCCLRYLSDRVVMIIPIMK